MIRQWTLNGDFLGFKPTGVARYAREVTAALDALAGDGHPLTRDLELTLVAPRDPASLNLENIATKIVRELVHPRIPQLWVQSQLPRHVRGGLVSFGNLAPIRVRRHIVCIHDLYSYVSPDAHGPALRLAHRFLLPILGRRARFITTVSNLSREHLIAHGIAAADHIDVTYNGADHALRWRTDDSRLALPERPFVLSIGRDQPHKNVELLWKLAPALAEHGIDLVMAGDVAHPQQRASLPENVHLLGRISDDDLGAAMRRALCFAFPSRIEGFGLPAVEAMSLGCPLIASTSPCLPEVCGEGAIYADPDSTAAWLAHILRLREDGAFRAALIAKGRDRAARYTWRGVAEIYLELMARIDRDDPPR